MLNALDMSALDALAPDPSFNPYTDALDYPPVIRRQLDARPLAPKWLRALIKRVWAERYAAFDIDAKGGIPYLPETGRISRRKIEDLTGRGALVAYVRALVTAHAEAKNTLPVLVIDSRAARGVVLVRLPLQGGAR